MVSPILIDPWGSTLIEDYEKLTKDFGLDTFNPSQLPDPNRIMRRNVVFASQDLDLIIKAIKQKKPYYVLSGIMPTAEKIHFGNKMVVENISYFQKHNAQTYVVVADLEALATRGVDLDTARKNALNFQIPAYIALGLDPKKTIFYFQSENKKVIHLAYDFSKKVTVNEFRAAYGNIDAAKIMSSLTQSADILFPQLKERMPGIIPVGPDQAPHLRLTRDITKRTFNKYKFFAPSSLYHKYTPSLDGSFKMSKSKPGSYIELPEDPKKVYEKLKNAVTGGRKTISEQKKKGGQPEKCVIFELYKQHLVESDKELQKVYDDCKAGKLLCGEDKENACKLMTKFMNDFVKKLEKAKKQVKNLKFVKFN